MPAGRERFGCAAAGPFPTGARAKRSPGEAGWTKTGAVARDRSRSPSRRPDGPVVAKGCSSAGFAVYRHRSRGRSSNLPEAVFVSCRERRTTGSDCLDARSEPCALTHRDLRSASCELAPEPSILQLAGTDEPTTDRLTCQDQLRLCHQIRNSSWWRYYPPTPRQVPEQAEPTHGSPGSWRALEQGQNARTRPSSCGVATLAKAPAAHTA